MATTKVRRSTGIGAATIVALVCATAPLPGQSDGDLEARARMHEIYRSLREVYLSSLDPAAYMAPENRSEILASLAALSLSADQLQQHDELDTSLDYLRRSLARDAQQAARRYEDGLYEGSRFMLHQLTENCVACHSRQPTAERLFLGDDLAGVSAELISASERARLEVATRQFEAALRTYEELFASVPTVVSWSEVRGPVEDYLKLAIRVRGDLPRARSALNALRSTESIPDRYGAQLGRWIHELAELEATPLDGDPLSTASELVREGKLRKHFPADYRGFTYFVTASGLLHQYVGSDEADDELLPEAFYLLGVAESYISSSFWVSETEFFLETAIRLDPASPIAWDAYDQLVEYVTGGYSGSAGLQLPPDVERRLTELAQLIEQAQS